MGDGGSHRDLEALERQLQDARSELKRCQQAAQVGSWSLDLQDQTFHSSEQANVLIGIPPDSRPSFADVMTRLHPDDVAPAREALQGLLATGEPFAVEVRFRHLETDDLVYVVTRGEIQRGADGRPTAVIGSNQNITKRKLAEREQQRLQAQLTQSQKLELVGKLVGSVAHDFNNMLCAILGQAEVAMSELAPQHELQENLETIADITIRSGELTGQLLSCLRRRTVTPRPLDLNKAVADLFTMVSRLMPKNITMTWEPYQDPCLVNMDPSQIDQMVMNLCINARDSIQGLGSIAIDTKLVTVDEQSPLLPEKSESGPYVRLRVTDDGCGMNAQTQARVFAPFFTTKEAGKGTGLGLATVREIVTKSVGFIDVRSEVGSGTSFDIYLPRYEGEMLAQAPTRAVMPSHHGEETVLIVEEEPAILEVTARLLGDLGYRILTAGTPSEALRLADKHSADIDILVTEVEMSEMNGLELFSQLEVMCEGLRCLFVSGYTSDVIIEKGGLLGDANFLQKPFSIIILAQKIRSLLTPEEDGSSRH